ncbi:hypothetical protein BpHYR1_053365 [Brachionus plicatilis]|uniref:Uncharacterized protein n=1 Tax=Brachionus plicatilis TaxID=10195 RepID=A0A3M7S7U4_BRAPC|nr:hypothetical protein BpHYR1_053365 [Brachionus plicatilis]
MTILSGTLSSKNSRYVFGPRKVQVYTSQYQYQKKSTRRATSTGDELNETRCSLSGLKLDKIQVFFRKFLS